MPLSISSLVGGAANNATRAGLGSQNQTSTSVAPTTTANTPLNIAWGGQPRVTTPNSFTNNPAQTFGQSGGFPTSPQTSNPQTPFTGNFGIGTPTPQTTPVQPTGSTPSPQDAGLLAQTNLGMSPTSNSSYQNFLNPNNTNQPYQSQNAPGAYTDLNGNTIDANGNIISLGQNLQNQINSGSAQSAALANGNATFPGLVGQSSNIAQGNLALGQTANQLGQNFAQQYNDIKNRYENAQAGDVTTGTTPVGQGNAMVAANTEANKLQGLAQAYQGQLQGNQQQLAAQQQAQSGLLNAAQLAKPEGNTAYFGSPLTGNVVGSSGTGGNPGNSLLGNAGTGNGLIDNSVENALEQIRNGASTTDATSLLVGDKVGLTAFSNAMRQYDPNWSITSSNAIAAQNMTQGQQYQGQAAQLSTTLQQLDKLTPTITNFLNGSGLNGQKLPIGNESIKTYIGELQNPADVKSLNAMLADVKTYTAQILGNSGLNPSEVAATVNSFDPSSLNAQQLNSFLSNLTNLGQTRLQPIQQTSQASYGGQNTTIPFSGAQANPSTTPNISPNTGTPGTNDPLLQGLIGGGINAVGGLGNLIGGVVGHVGGAISSVFK